MNRTKVRITPREFDEALNQMAVRSISMALVEAEKAFRHIKQTDSYLQDMDFNKGAAVLLSELALLENTLQGSLQCCKDIRKRLAANMN